MIERIGIVGGGQLGMMLTETALALGFDVTVIDPVENCPAAQVGADQIQANLTDPDAVHDLANEVDVVTWEIEHINASALTDLGVDVQPSPETLINIQDKFYQKSMLEQKGIPVAEFMTINSDLDLTAALEEFNGVIIKARRGGYDGRGNQVVSITTTWDELQQRFGGVPLYAEALEDFQKELAVIIVRDKGGNTGQYPVVETIHKNNICHLVLAPAAIDPGVQALAKEVAHETASLLGGAGIFAIEMFLTQDNEILVNEIAPRVHNSGHHTIEANWTSQFEQHIRAITGLPLGSMEMVRPAAAMINILGERNGEVAISGLERVLGIQDTYVHLYGKSPTKVDRKMGHITVLANDLDEARLIAEKARGEISV